MLVRTVEFFAFWLILFGLNTRGVLVGVLAAVITASVSLRLVPTGEWRFRPKAAMRLALRFLRESIVAGMDVARRALDPQLPLRPGFVIYHSRLPPGLTREAFCAMTSLLPGTLPCGSDERGNLVVHCLDVSQAVTEELTAQEELLVQAIGDGYRDV